MKWLLLLGLPTGGVTLAQTAGDPWTAPLAAYGLGGILLAFVLWLYLDERREHKALRAKVLDDVLPALLANNETMRDSGAAMERMTTMAHQIAGRMNVDPVQFAEWQRTMRAVARKMGVE